MTGNANDFALMRFSTAALPERDRVPMLRDFIGPVMARFEIEPVRGEPVHFEISARAAPDLTVSTLAFSAIRAERTPALSADGSEDCLLSWLHSPGNFVLYRGNELRPGEGDGTLISLADPFVCGTVCGIARGMSIGVPRKVLAAMVPGLEDSLGRAPVRDSEAARLLKNYVGLLDQNQPASPELRRLIVTHVHDLVALALGASRDAAEIANGRGLRAARLHALKADIRASLGQREVSLTALAARHGVSPRYVQAVFESDGTTFSQFLASERLDRAYRMLCDPLQIARSITAIAYAAGFNDLSHFNRAFRRRYGATPSDLRAAVQRERSE